MTVFAVNTHQKHGLAFPVNASAAGFNPGGFPLPSAASVLLGSVPPPEAVGGGDGPEAVAAGLFEALKLPWRPNATKVCAPRPIAGREGREGLEAPELLAGWGGWDPLGGVVWKGSPEFFWGEEKETQLEAWLGGWGLAGEVPPPNFQVRPTRRLARVEGW